jgi:hypothetical protein
MYYKLLSNGRKNKTDGNNKANDYPQSKPLLLRQSAATPKTRKTRPENDFGAGCFMGYKAQNPLKSIGQKKKSRFFYQNLLSYLVRVSEKRRKRVEI